jgi:hypothetical protein
VIDPSARGDAHHGIGRGVFTLILVGDSLAELSITHKAFSRWVVTLIIGVKALDKVVAAVEELELSPRVIEPEEVSTNPATAVLHGVDA